MAIFHCYVSSPEGTCFSVKIIVLFTVSCCGAKYRMGRDMLLKFEAPPMIDLPGICAVAIAWASAWWLDKEVPTFKGGNPELP